jgi:LPS-assembly lipoprotein
VSEFLLRYQVGFDVRDASGKELVKRQEITLQRTFSFDKNAVLAMEREAEEMRARMREDAVQQIIRRLAAVRT